MRRSTSFLLALFISFCFLSPLQTAHAAITPTGNVEPADPITWTLSTGGYIGKTAPGTLTVDGDSDLLSYDAYIAYETAAHGVASEVTVTGTGSTWINAADLCVARFGIGTLDITAGGSVTNINGYIGLLKLAAEGTVTVNGTGSTWTNSEDLYVGGSSTRTGGTGILTVQNDGTVEVTNTLKVWSTGNVELLGGQINTGSFIVTTGGTFTHDLGTLTVTGGTFDPGTADYTIDGAESTSIRLTGASATLSGYLHVADTDKGTLTISGGGIVVDNTTVIGVQSGSQGTVTVDGAGSAWANTLHCVVGHLGTGTLEITGGGIVCNNDDGYIGDQAGSSGTVTVDGTDSAWTSAGHLQVGFMGTGTLDITGGGLVANDYSYIGNQSGASGTVTVGADSTWINSGSLYVGYDGSGTLDVLEGGTVHSNACAIGLSHSTDDTHGKVTVDGTGSTWYNTVETHVGYHGKGTLTVSGGGYAQTSIGVIGDRSDGTGTVTVTGSESTWTNDDSIYVGYEGSGALEVENGGYVSNVSAWLGYETGSIGTATVDGATSSWANTGELRVGYRGSGTLTVSGGGSVSNSSGCIGRYAGSTGMATVDGAGSTWTSWDFELTVGYEGSGALEVENGGSIFAEGCLIGRSTGSTGTVTVDGAGSMIYHAGLVVGLDGTGKLTITEGGLVKVMSELVIDYNGGDDSFINMATGGMLALRGEADGSLTEFLDLIDGSDAINYWDDSISDWSDISGAMNCRDYTLDYLTAGDLDGYTLLTVQRAIDGDANGDGVVNVTDLGILATNYGTSGCEWCQADFTGEGDVNVSDLGVLATNYGNTTATAAQSVPEPGMLMLLAICGLTLLGLVARRRKR